RLEDVRRRAIAVARGRDLVPVVRVVRRLIDHREHFARVDVQHDERARFRVMLLYGGLELAIGEILNAKIDARVQIRAWTRCSNALDVFDGPSVPILDDALRAGLGTKPTIVGELESFLADIVVLLREPEQMTRDFTGRIETLIFAQQIDAWDLEIRDLLRIARPHVPHEIDELAVEVARDELLEPLLVAIQRFGEALELIRRANELGRARPHRIDRRAGGERLAVSIVDPAAHRGDLRDARVARVALLLEKRLIDELQLHGTREERNRREHEQHEHEPQTAAELFLGKGAGLATYHGVTIRTSFGRGITMRKLPRAVCSTRPCVAHALCSSLSCPHSISSASRSACSDCSSTNNVRVSWRDQTTASAEANNDAQSAIMATFIAGLMRPPSRRRA